VTKGVPAECFGTGLVAPATGGRGPALPASTYEMDYFQAVAFFEIGFGPEITRDYFAIEFHGYAVGFHSQDFD